MERIKAYLEEQIKTDPALAEAYSESKLKGCWDFIKDQARKQAKDGCAMIEDAVVYKWARDFMLGDIPEAKKEVKEPEQKAPEEITESNSPAEDDVEIIAEGIPGEIEAVEPEELPPKGKVIMEGVVEITPDLHFEEPKRVDPPLCRDCGYFHAGNCLKKGTKRNSNGLTCPEFIKAATEADIKPIQEKLKIEKVIEDAPAAPAEEIKPVIQKEKKSKKKVEEYDGPSLFDFDNLY